VRAIIPAAVRSPALPALSGRAARSLDIGRHLFFAEDPHLVDQLLHRIGRKVNRGLETKVRAQVEELERVGRLRRFLSPQLAQAIVSAGDEKALESHRREIVALFCDLRGFTGFSETAELEDVMALLGEYHGAVGPLIRKYEGTLDRFTGDGMMVFFNDPRPCPDAPERAARPATRLCAEATDDQVLVSGRLAPSVGGVVEIEDLGERQLRGMARPASIANLRGPRL